MYRFNIRIIKNLMTRIFRNGFKSTSGSSILLIFLLLISLFGSNVVAYSSLASLTTNPINIYHNQNLNREYPDDTSCRYHRSHQGWNVLDWWQQNIKEDLFNLNKSPDNIANEAPISRFVQLVEQDHSAKESGPDVSHHEYYQRLHFNDLETSETNLQQEKIQPNLNNKNKTMNSQEKRRFKLELPKLLLSSSDKMTQNHPSESFQENQEQNFFIPKSSLSSIKSLFFEYFTQIRSNLYDPHIYINLKRNLRAKFIEYGLQTAIQGFYHQKRNDKGHNIVGIYPSIYRNTSRHHEDSVLVIGAHYDTVARSPGVEDNGSGSVVVLELARLLHKYRCKLNTTIIFVLFDMEEDGLIGSKHFVRNYLIPVEMDKNQIPVKGAIIMDMLLEYDTTVNSQMTQGIGNLLPEWNDRVRQNRFRADFTAVWARRNIDSELYQSLQSNWLNRQKYKLFLMDPPLPKLGRQLTHDFSTKKLRPYSTFLRSDHSSFWYPHSIKNETINAILLTDLGPWRRKVADKYHSSSDNSKLLTRANLLFLKNAIDSIMKTVLDISNGYCQELLR